MNNQLTDPKAPTIAVGTRCIHTSKWEKRPCRVVAHDGAVVVVKMERGGYVGVPEKSLTPISTVGDC